LQATLPRSCLALLLLALPQAASAKGCPGIFLRDSQGYAASEGGAEPTADRRQKGERGVFLYYDVMDGERYLRLDRGDEHKASAIALQSGCKVPRLRPGGKY